MTLAIILNKQPGRAWFTSLDEICGAVLLDNKTRMTVAAITLQLLCKQKASIKPVNAAQGGVFENEEHMLVSRSITLCASQDDAPQKQCEVIEPGRHSFPFRMEMPLVTSCHTTRILDRTHVESALPPSFRLSSPTLQVSITYYLRAVVERPSFLKRNLTAVEALRFRPLYPPDLPVCSEGTQYVKVAAHLSLGTDPKLPDDGNQPPPYALAAALEVAVPSPNIIYPGDHVNLAIVVSIPREIQNSVGAIWLRNLAIRIRTTTTARVGCYERSNVSYVDICNVEGFTLLELPAGSENFTIPPDLWKHQIYPFMLPSFASCGIKRIERLEVLAGFATQTSENLHVVVTEVEVTIKNGPSASPAVDTE